MELLHRALRHLTTGTHRARGWLTGLVALAAAVGLRAQSGGHATDFTTTEYYPDQKHVKSVLSGTEALPEPGGRLVIKQLKLEQFDSDGKLACVVTAPECIYDTVAGTANSAGPLELRNGDGKFQVTGEGFLWRQTIQFLTISNQVHTVIENGATFNTRP